MEPIAGVRAGVDDVAVSEGESADRDAPEAILRRGCMEPAIVPSSALFSTWGSTCGILWSTRGKAARRGVAEEDMVSNERRAMVLVRVEDAVLLRALFFALPGGLFTSFVPLGGRARTGTASESLLRPSSVELWATADLFFHS